jgi:hypothetical protein
MYLRYYTTYCVTGSLSAPDHYPTRSHFKAKLLCFYRRNLPTRQRSGHGIHHLRNNGRNVYTSRRLLHQTPPYSKGITFYSRYVYDILIIHDSSYTNPNAILQYANIIDILQIIPTPENAGQINFPDLTITRKSTYLERHL